VGETDARSETFVVLFDERVECAAVSAALLNRHADGQRSLFYR
jgi:hypothetical protein